MSENAKKDPTPVELAVAKVGEALALAIAALIQPAQKFLEASMEAATITAKANAEVAVIRAGVAKIEAEAALVAANHQKRMGEVVGPIEIEAAAAEAEAKRNKAQLHVKQTAHELLSFGVKKNGEQPKEQRAV